MSAEPMGTHARTLHDEANREQARSLFENVKDLINEQKALVVRLTEELTQVRRERDIAIGSAELNGDIVKAQQAHMTEQGGEIARLEKKVEAFAEDIERLHEELILKEHRIADLETIIENQVACEKCDRPYGRCPVLNNKTAEEWAVEAASLAFPYHGCHCGPVDLRSFPTLTLSDGHESTCDTADVSILSARRFAERGLAS